MDTAILKDTTVGDVGGVAMGCGNFVEDVFTLADGTPTRGPTATLADLDADTRVVVGVGSEVTLGGASWRISRVTTEDPYARVILVRTDRGPTVDGVDFGPATDLATLVGRHLVLSPVGTPHVDDRSPADWLVRTYRALHEIDPVAAGRLSHAVANHLGSGDPEVDGPILRFFSDTHFAPGGERIAEVARDLSRYPSHVRDPTPGGVTHFLRELLLRQAMRWGEGAAVNDDVLTSAREDILTGDGERLISGVASQDPDWMRQHLTTIAALYPSSGASLFRALRDMGEDDQTCIQRLLPFADATSRRYMADDVRYLYFRDPAERDRLLALL